MSATESRKRSLFDSSGSEDDEPSASKVCRSESDGQKTPEKKEEKTEDMKKEVPLSPAQKARIEQNRQKALLIRQDKINRRTPYVKPKENKDEGKKIIRINDTKLIDTGGGFFMEEEEIMDDDMMAAMKLVKEPAPLIEEDRPHCLECNQVFNNSYLFHSFDHPVCDQCRDNDDKHSLITKTDAKNEYLLKDSDLEKREPPLKFIVRKNPHNSRWGDMKLFLKLQVEKRSLEIWGTEEALEEAIEKKEDQREISKQKRFNKKMKELRMNVRSSLYTRATKNHEHEYGEETYLPDEDEYSRTCQTCGHTYTYDKL
ncbi:DNA repair protein complementing XP-A cells [Palaemon carinicauda]|uniref:DNA repair protein complementing XP-A cells n=1 Tax=Palaemon carinicauda TaxID=392227 RepID=UPI0035B5A7BB